MIKNHIGSFLSKLLVYSKLRLPKLPFSALFSISNPEGNVSKFVKLSSLVLLTFVGVRYPDSRACKNFFIDSNLNTKFNKNFTTKIYRKYSRLKTSLYSLDINISRSEIFMTNYKIRNHQNIITNYLINDISNDL